MVEWRAWGAALAACLVSAASGVYIGTEYAEPDYSVLGSAQGCTPTDDWPCWKVSDDGCLLIANSTHITRHCQGVDGGWDPFAPEGGAR